MASEEDDNHMGGEVDMADEAAGDDHKLSIRIVGELNYLTSISSRYNIFKVPEHLRSVNEKAYEPYILAIGPYHRGKDHLKRMEEHKKQYLKELLERGREEREEDLIREEDVTKYVTALRALEEKARKCYAESIGLKTDDFVKMMLLDGCFIIELLRRFMGEKMLKVGSSSDDSFIFSCSITKKLGRDLLLVENQLPFFVLEELFTMTSEDLAASYNLQDMIMYFFAFSVFSERRPFLRWKRRRLLRGLNYSEKPTDEIKHLLSFLHEYWFSPREIYRRPHAGSIIESSWQFIRWLQKIYLSFKLRHNEKYMRFMRCATELKEAGIKFKKIEGNCLFDISFENGIMKIPRLEITGETESLFRNLIVYEQFSPGENFTDDKPVSDYMKFMDCLINSQKDVELLCNRNILHNCLGDDESVANMFNRLGDFVRLSPNHYLNVFYDVNKHCGQKRHRWLANLRHRYFNSPWAFISFFAAVLLLMLTAVQTVYSVLAYYERK